VSVLKKEIGHNVLKSEEEKESCDGHRQESFDEENSPQNKNEESRPKKNDLSCRKPFTQQHDLFSFKPRRETNPAVAIMQDSRSGLLYLESV
jgi:hypothetical protein